MQPKTWGSAQCVKLLAREKKLVRSFALGPVRGILHKRPGVANVSQKTHGSKTARLPLRKYPPMPKTSPNRTLKTSSGLGRLDAFCQQRKVPILESNRTFTPRPAFSTIASGECWPRYLLYEAPKMRKGSARQQNGPPSARPGGRCGGRRPKFEWCFRFVNGLA